MPFDGAVPSFLHYIVGTPIMVIGLANPAGLAAQDRPTWQQIDHEAVEFRPRPDRIAVHID